MNYLDIKAEEIRKKIEEQMKICPRCGTKQPLNEIWIQKKSWKGKHGIENLKSLCPSCDEDYRIYVQYNERFESLKTLDDFRVIFEEFLLSPKLEMTAIERSRQVLKELAGLRVEIAIEAQKFSGRFASRSKRMDGVYPIGQSVFAPQIIEEFGEKAKSVGWNKFLLSQVAEVKAVKSGLEKEIAKQVALYPIWNMYAKYIPGIGEWLTGYLIASIGDPKKFPDTGHLWGNAGLRVTEEGFAQSRTRDTKLNYNPTLKTVVCYILPQSLQWQKSRFPDSPYSQLFESVRLKEQEKAVNAHPAKCYAKGCKETEIVNLGFKEDPEKGRVFQGFCCKKTLGTKKEHKFYNPAHIQARVMREVGKKFYADFYHAWLHLIGENPDIYGKEGEHAENKRILWVFAQALKAETGN